jgi:hypothetical protein
MQLSCVQTRLQLFRQLPDTIIPIEMIERFVRTEPARATLYAVTTTGSRIVVTDNHAVAIVAQDSDAEAPLLAFTPIGRLRPYAHCLRRFVLGAYLPGGNYDALAAAYGGEDHRVTRDSLGRVIDAVGDVAARRMLHRRDKDAAAKRALDSLLTCINRADTFTAAGNGVNGTPIPWCAAIIAAAACRIVAGRKPCAMPHVAGFTINLNPQGALSS